MDKKYIEDLTEKIADFFEEKGLNQTPYGEGVQDGLLVFSCLLKKENGFKGKNIEEDNKIFIKMLTALMMEEIRQDYATNKKKPMPNNDKPTK